MVYTLYSFSVNVCSLYVPGKHSEEGFRAGSMWVVGRDPYRTLFGKKEFRGCHSDPSHRTSIIAIK